MAAAYGTSSYGAVAASAGPSAPPLDESRTIPVMETFEEKKLLSDMEELYAIMRTTEHLENAYIRDMISAEEYKATCSKLLRSYELQKSKLTSMRAFTDIGAWIKEYHVNLPQAHYRLELVKLPATDTHYTDDSKPDALLACETTSAIITAQDTLRLGQTEVDQVMPYVSAALESLNKHAFLGLDFEPKTKLQAWLRLLNGLKASDSLTADQARQLLFDLDQTYSSFVSKLGGKK
jgi:ESCRT-I complex subunit VPS28